MRTIKIIWVTVLQMFQTTEGRQGDRRGVAGAGGAEVKEGRSFAPNSEQGGGVKMHGSIHQSVWEAERLTSTCRSLSEELGGSGVRKGVLILEHQVALIMEAGTGTLHLVCSLLIQIS